MFCASRRIVLRALAVSAVLAGCAETTDPSVSSSLELKLAKGTPSGSSMVQMAGPAGNSAANNVNSSGVIAGGRAGGCNSGKLPVVWANAAASPVDLPLIAPWCNGSALYINDAGVMMGHLNPGAERVAVRWIPENGAYRVEALGLLPDGAPPDMTDQNQAGHAIANRNGGAGLGRTFWWSAETGFLPVPYANGATSCNLQALNELEEIVGGCTVNGVISAAFWSSPASVPILLPRLSGYNYAHAAGALNNNGVAAGYAMNSLKSGLVETGVRYTRTGSTWTIEVLPTLGSNRTSVWDINDSGWITGASDVLNSKYHAFLLVPGRPIKDLGSIGPESYGFAISPASAVNKFVVGITDVSSYRRAVAWPVE